MLEPLTDDPAAKPQARALLGSLYIELDRPADVLQALAPLTEGPEATAAALYNAGRAALMLERVEEGAEYLERSVEQQPGTPAARTLGLLRERQGRPNDAVRLLDPWIRRNPDDLNARLVATRAALRLRRLDEADRFLSDLPQSDPRVRLLWSRLLLLQDRPYGALGMLRPVAAGDAPEAVGLAARLSMAEVYLELGKTEKARSLLERARERRPENPRVRTFLQRLKRPTDDG